MESSVAAICSLVRVHRLLDHYSRDWVSSLSQRKLVRSGLYSSLYRSPYFYPTDCSVEANIQNKGK